MGDYDIQNITMHTRFMKNEESTYELCSTCPIVGGICGYLNTGATVDITNVTMDFLATNVANVGLIAGEIRPTGVLTISGVK